MPRARSRRYIVNMVDGGEVGRQPDRLVVEEPLTIELDGTLVATTMRTPGHDFELAVGYCHAEGLLAGQPVKTVRYCASGAASESAYNIVTVDTAGRAPVPVPRLTPTSTSCGWCGSEQIDTMFDRLTRLPPAAPPEHAHIVGLAERVAASTPLHAATGALHSAACFDRDGDVVCVREDIGRHNAVDKVVGNLVLSGELPARSLGLFISGRASVEMVQKAWAAGFHCLIAASAPSALAVDAARRAGLFLAGFVRDDTYNVYAPERLG